METVVRSEDPKRRGRPSLGLGPAVTIRVSKRVADALEAEAARYGGRIRKRYSIRELMDALLDQGMLVNLDKVEESDG